MLSFTPLPLLGNPHLQTVLGHLFSRARPALPLQTTFVPLPDGDALAAHDALPSSWRHGHPLAVLVHGLGGCHASGYMVRVTNLLARRGFRVVAVDLRGAGAGVVRASRLYNAACSDDIRAVLDAYHALAPRSPIGLVGFSLGGNIVLKLAGEAADAVPFLSAVAALAPPIDLALCSTRIERLPWYDRFFARNLAGQLRQHEAMHPHVPPLPLPRRLTIRVFDDIYTAPRGGYRDAPDYYARASALPYVAAIKVPTLVLTARDDPFIAVAPIEGLPRRAPLEVHIAPSGGHLGFLGRDGQGGVRWAERFVVEWLAARLVGGPAA